MTSYLDSPVPFEEVPQSPTVEYASTGQCPLGKKYRNPSFVTGSCVKNRKNAIYPPDDRCPQTMHWRETKFRPGKCVKVPFKKPRNKLTYNGVGIGGKAPKVQCNSALVDPLFEDHLKVIRSYLRELFTVPISKDFLVQSKLFVKVNKKFLQSLKKASKQSKCTLVISLPQEKIVRDLIIQEVYALNRDLITEEQWEYIKKMAELDLFLREANKLVKEQKENFKFTDKYTKGLLELREGLLYMRQHHLLPKQNLLVAESIYNYMLQFENVESLHVLNPHNKFVPLEIQNKNKTSLAYSVVQNGYVSTNISFYYTEETDPLPQFSIPGRQVKNSIRKSTPTITIASIEPISGAEPMSNEELLTLYDVSTLQYLFTTPRDQGALLTSRGQEMNNMFSVLSDKFRATYGDDGTQVEGPWYLLAHNFENQNYLPTLQQLEAKYKGPFWVMPLTTEDASEMIQLNILFQAFKNTPDVTLNNKGRELKMRYESLKQRLYAQYSTPDQRKEFIQGIEKNFTLDELIQKYGVFWVKQNDASATSMTEEEMTELLDLQVIHTLFLKKGNTVMITERGQDLERRREVLFQKLSDYFKGTKTKEELLQYLQNYSSEHPILGLEALEAKYGGPFWGVVI